MPFGLVSGVGPGMGVLDRVETAQGKGQFGGKCRASHCNQWGLCGVVVRNCGNGSRCHETSPYLGDVTPSNTPIPRPTPLTTPNGISISCFSTIHPPHRQTDGPNKWDSDAANKKLRRQFYTSQRHSPDGYTTKFKHGVRVQVYIQ